MTNLCLVTPAYYAANEGAILAAASAGGVSNFSPVVGDGGLLLCRGVDPVALPAADVYDLPGPLEEEGQADYRARMATAAAGAFNQVKLGPKEVFLMRDEKLIHQCRKMNGWPQIPSEV